MPLSQNQVIELHGLLTEDPESRITGANYLFDLTESKKRVERPEQGLYWLTWFYQDLLNKNQRELAAILLWGATVANPNPRSVKIIWNALRTRRKVLAKGGGGQGKSYTAALDFLMQWSRDPHGTAIRLISTTTGHLKSNVWSTMVRRHGDAAIPLPGFVREAYIGVDINDLHGSITRVAIQPGTEGAALRGLHPIPRKKTHPLFGDLTRGFALLDEAEDIVDVVWKGVDNLTSTQNVWVYAAANPIDQSSEFGQRAMPLGGWQEFDREEDTVWEGQQGWHVIRLDPAKSENIVQNRIVHEGFLDPEGFRTYEAKGIDHPDYDTFARGRYPLSTAKYNVIPQYFVNDIKRICSFTQMPHNVASLDPAFAEGGDLAILTTGRYGPCNGYLSKDGEVIEKIDPPRWMLNIEQQFPLLRRKTQEMVEDVVEICSGLHVRPEWFVMDATGNATGVADLLEDPKVFGPILKVIWGGDATDRKILEEDKELASERYLRLTSEMWFAFARWIEFNYLKIHPTMQTQKLYTQLTARRYTQPRKNIRLVETKDEYKKNTKLSSPDEADSAIMLVHLCRMRGQEVPFVLPREEKPQRKTLWDEYFKRGEPEELEESIEWIN